jgi:hypothetical protein
MYYFPSFMNEEAQSEIYIEALLVPVPFHYVLILELAQENLKYSIKLVDKGVGQVGPPVDHAGREESHKQRDRPDVETTGGQ